MGMMVCSNALYSGDDSTGDWAKKTLKAAN
jgi:hypothetical protein